MLRVENVTRGAVLVEHGRVANNILTRLRGLIGVHDLPPGDGMLISPSNSIHCMFMSIPIDVLYVSKQDQVVAMDPEMKPWRVGSIHRHARYVIELPAGTIARSVTAPGDQLKISY